MGLKSLKSIAFLLSLTLLLIIPPLEKGWGEERIEPVWTYPVEGNIGAVQSIPCISDGVVYFGTDSSYFYALDASNGKELWRYKALGKIRGVPLIIREKEKSSIYFATLGGYIYGLKSSGENKFPPVRLDAEIVSTVVSDGKELYFATENKIYALNSLDGLFSNNWSKPKIDRISDGCWLVATYDELYIGSNKGKLYAFKNVDGTPLREFVTYGEVDSAPWVKDGVLYVGSGDTNLYAINVSNFSKKWVFTQPEGEIHSSLWLSEGAAYFGCDDNKLYAVNISDGRLKKGFTPYITGNAIRSSPLVWHNLVYFGSNDGRFYAIDKKTGALKSGWPYNTGGKVYSSPSLDWANNRIIIGSDGGKLFAFPAE